MSKRDFVVYIAGPYSADSKAEVFYNIGEAVRFATEVRQAGFSAIVPHLESMFCEESLSENEWLEHGISLMKRCSAVLDIRRGQRSHGTSLEVTAANVFGIPVVTSVWNIRNLYEELHCDPTVLRMKEVAR